MHAPTSVLLHTVIAASLINIASFAQAADKPEGYVSAMRYVSLDVQGDNADSRQYSGTGSFTLGRYMWLQGTMAKLTDTSDNASNTLGDLSTYGAGLGLKRKHLQVSVNFNARKNEQNFKQRDINAAFDWMDDQFSMGVDIFHRSNDNSSNATIPLPRKNLTNVALHLEQDLTGNGYGLHTNLNITDALSVSLGAMKYDYSSHYVLTSSTHPILNLVPIDTVLTDTERRGFFPRLLQSAASQLNRDAALLDSSYNVGLSYQFNSFALSSQYMRDKALDIDDVTNTFTLGALVFLGDHWIVAPSIGQSKSDQFEDVTFGGLSVSYNW